MVLTRLAELGLMSRESVNTLLESYRYLRTVENRLQQYGDRQTHDLPAQAEERLAIAFTLGHPNWERFKQELDAVRRNVQAIFDEVITGGHTGEETPLNLTGDPEQAAMALIALGFTDTHAALPLLKTFQGSHAIRKLTTRGQAEL